MSTIAHSDRFTVVYELGGSHVDFRVYELIYESEGKRFYEEKEGIIPAVDTTDDLEKAQAIFTGFVKWDGCSHFDFGETNHHICGSESAKAWGELIPAVHATCMMLMGKESL